MTEQPDVQTRTFANSGITEENCRIDEIEVKRRQSQYASYALPSNLSQLWTVIKLEFKQYFKSLKLVLLYLMVILVPVLQMCNMDVIGLFGGLMTLLSNGTEMTSLQYMHYCLILIPTVMVLAMAILCGRTISQEYENRTCFLNMPLPVDRWVFFTGKFIAIAITSFSILLVGYGMAMLATNMKYGEIAVSPVIQSLLLSMITMLSFIATGIFFSCVMKKRGGVVSLALMMFIIPLIPLALSLLLNKSSMPGWTEIFLYTPPFATDVSLIMLGWEPTMSLSGFAIGNMYNVAPSLIGTVVSMLLWAAVFFTAGIIMFDRREA